MPLSRLRLFAAVTALKLALFPAYHSTDYEVHRNWLAVTAGRPLAEWYTDATSQWTLDYPPLFAWFQRGLAVVAARFAPEALTLSAEAVDSPAIAAFQRGSVVVMDGLLALAAAGVTASLPPATRTLTFGLLVAGPGLLLLDHIHFQYNGWLVGLLLAAVGWSAGAGADRGNGPSRRPPSLLLTAAGAASYAALVCSKHLFAAVGPVFAVYFIALTLAAPRWGGKAAAAAAAVAVPVSAVLTLTLLPIYVTGGAAALRALASRLAPLDRGLVHAYWAPNAWALAAGVDGLGAAVAKRVARSPAALASLPPPLASAATSVAAAAAAGAGAFSSGLVKVTRFACFPTPGPAAAAGAALAAQVPALVALAVTPAPARAGLLLPAVEFAGLGAAAWGYHVHEKAAVPYVLLAALGLGLASGGGKGGGGGLASIPLPPPGRPVAALAADPAHYATLALAAYHALLPLIPGASEWGVKASLVACHAVVACGLCLVKADAGGKGGAAGGWVFRRRPLLLAGLLAAVELYASLLHPVLLGGGGDRLPFLPLATTSLACAVGLVGEWGVAAAAWAGEARAAAAERWGGDRGRRAASKKRR